MVAVAVVVHATKVGASVRAELRDALKAAALDTSWTTVPKAGKAKDAVRKARKHGADVVVVCGGDGTVRAASEGLVDTGVALAVVPAGTANLFANGLRLPTAPSDIVNLVVEGHRTTIDSGVCNDMTFNVMAGTGLDAGLIDGADAAKKRLGMLSYVRAGLVDARRREPFQAEVTIDGAPFYDGSSTCVLVGNIGTLKGGLVAFPDASPHDGRLDVAVVTAVGLREWGAVLISAARRRQASSGHAHLGQGTDIVVRLDGKHRFELDGGCKGTTKRLQFGIRPQSLVVCAPAG